MKNDLRKTALKILLLGAILVGLNFVYKQFFFEHDLQKHSEVINVVRAVPLDADIVYVGESSNITFRADDADKRPISGFLADHFPNLKVADITKAASHSGIYYHLLNNIPAQSDLKTVVVTLNLRSFNAQWIYSNLETPLQKSMVLLKPYPPIFNRFLLSFKAYDIKSDAERETQFLKKWEADEFDVPFAFPHKNVREWDYWMATHGIKDENGKINYPLTELATHYIKAYGFQLDTTSNPRIDDFNDIIKLAKERNWNLVLNLLAENTERAEELFGNDLTYFMEENVKTLKAYFAARGIPVVDNLNAVPDEQYIDRNWTTEHYAEDGRKTIAGNVAKALQDLYPSDYVEINYEDFIQTRYYNDCDNNVIWGQMQTITNELAFSGAKSSKTGNGAEFSITFEFPFSKIPDSLKNKVRVQFMVLQKSPDHGARLVIQANGDNIEGFWESYGLNLPDNKTDEWFKFDNTFPIPESIKNADLIKIYLYNPTTPEVYVDDFEVEFLP